MPVNGLIWDLEQQRKSHSWIFRKTSYGNSFEVICTCGGWSDMRLHTNKDDAITRIVVLKLTKQKCPFMNLAVMI